MQLTHERKKRVIDLYFNQHKTYAKIAQIERISPRDIQAIINEEQDRRQKYKLERQQQEISSKAYKLFSEGKRPVEVAIALNLIEPETTKLYREYWRLKRLHILDSIFKETNGKLGLFLKLYRLMKEKGMTIEQVVNALDIAIHKLPYMESLYNQLKDEVDKLQYTIQGLLNNIEALKYKISILDKASFVCEQNCKRTEQQLQELIDKKNRTEDLIGNVLKSDNESYSKLKQMVKENVKGALSENKQVISTAFTALLQTLTSDPKMINIIYKLVTANDGEHHKDNDINITKYLESNKDAVLDLVEKNYENLIDVLANNVMNTAANSSYNSTLSLQSPSTFPSLSNQSDTHRKEDQEIYDDSKGDIAD